jgi:hypothetical protein
MNKQCPKCGAERKTEIECPSCGIVYSKYEKTLERQQAKEKELNANEDMKIFKSVIIVLVSVIVGFLAGFLSHKFFVSNDKKAVTYYVVEEESELTRHKEQKKQKPPPTEFVKIEDARVVRNYHNHRDPSLCTSLEFKGTLKNLTNKNYTLHTTFRLKDSDGFTLEKDNGFYEIEANSGTKKPRVLETFSSGSNDFTCEDVVLVELQYFVGELSTEKKIKLPIVSE